MRKKNTKIYPAKLFTKLNLSCSTWFFYFTGTFITVFAFSLLSSHALAAPFFSDGFESGDLTHTENGANWFAGSYSQATASTTVARTGSYSARFRFVPGDSAEQRFDLGSAKDEVYIRYYVYFPANYTHKTTLSYNDKFIRLWNENELYSNNPLKVGASLMYDPTDKAQMLLEAYESGSNVLDCGGSMADFYTWGNWKLTAADLERWILFEFHFKLDEGAGNGAMEMWVDGVKKIGYTNLSWVGAPCGAVGHQYFLTGYLFGYAYTDTILTENMDIYVDDFTLADTYTGIGSGDATPPSAPSGLSVS